MYLYSSNRVKNQVFWQINPCWPLKPRSLLNNSCRCVGGICKNAPKHLDKTYCVLHPTTTTKTFPSCHSVSSKDGCRKLHISLLFPSLMLWWELVIFFYFNVALRHAFVFLVQKERGDMSFLTAVIWKSQLDGNWTFSCSRWKLFWFRVLSLSEDLQMTFKIGFLWVLDLRFVPLDLTFNICSSWTPVHVILHMKHVVNSRYTDRQKYGLGLQLITLLKMNQLLWEMSK